LAMSSEGTNRVNGEATPSGKWYFWFAFVKPGRQCKNRSELVGGGGGGGVRIHKKGLEAGFYNHEST
jgi:hypothetical protein